MKDFKGDWAVELARQKIASVARKMAQLDYGQECDTLLEVLDQLNGNAAEELHLVGKKQYISRSWVDDYMSGKRK